MASNRELGAGTLMVGLLWIWLEVRQLTLGARRREEKLRARLGLTQRA